MSVIFLFMLNACDGVMWVNTFNELGRFGLVWVGGLNGDAVGGAAMTGFELDRSIRFGGNGSSSLYDGSIGSDLILSRIRRHWARWLSKQYSRSSLSTCNSWMSDWSFCFSFSNWFTLSTRSFVWSTRRFRHRAGIYLIFFWKFLLQQTVERAKSSSLSSTSISE